MEHTFGPVPSRRLGFSLGVDVIPRKTCTLSCVYCQIGPTPKVTLRRKRYLTAEQIRPEIAVALKQGRRIDHITFSGSGEPTLNSDLGRMIRQTKRLTDIPVAVITNGTLLHLARVRRDLQAADVVLPSLDAVSEPVFRKINRPHPGLTGRLMLNGLKQFRREYPGKIWLEIMLVKGINDSPAELRKFRRALREIRPDKVQLNTVVRPPAEQGVCPLTRKEMEAAAKLIGVDCEIIAEFRKRAGERRPITARDVLAMLSRRPLTLKDLKSLTGLSRDKLSETLKKLGSGGSVGTQKIGTKTYYRIV